VEEEAQLALEFRPGGDTAFERGAASGAFGREDGPSDIGIRTGKVGFQDVASDHLLRLALAEDMEVAHR